MVTMTDAKGDFLSYIVTLTSLQLQTAGGATVETVPASTKVDFAKLVDLSEVLSAGQIPPAEYVSAKLTIDYSNAQITADDGTGNPVALAPVDSAGNPITGPLVVTVQLDATHHLKITAGVLARLALDFNLAASNAVDLTADTVTVTPTLVATLAPADDRPVRVRGTVVSTTSAQEQIVVAVQPFQDQGATVGQVTVQVGPTTTYQVNGTAYVGDAGLTALAALPANSKIAAFGTEETGAQPIITATSVLAGSSLENPGQDRLSGTVIARDQTSLTVRAGTWSNGGDFDFERQDAKVMLGTGTVVVAAGSMGAFTGTDISVGQHIEAAGTAARAADHSLVLDASTGQVSLDVTPVWGTVNTQQSGSITLALRSIDGLPATAFNFSGTGSSAANDATAAAYVVNTGSLTQNAVTVGGVTGARGFVTPFGTAPPDFTAQTLIALPAVQAQLNVHFDHGGSATAFAPLTSASTGLLLQVPVDNGDNDGNGNGNSGGGNSGDSNGDGNSGSNGSGHDGSNDNGVDNNSIQIGPQVTDVRNIPSPLLIVPNTSGTTDVFTISHQGPMKSETFYDFASFVTALAGELNGSSILVHAVSAAGQYDVTSNTLTATRIAVVLTN
ncbi:MAG TPA: hypothetical protein VGV09_08685 [Steroidobacteraceae bacterium]|nr:hypothetical protein [Steroidobacteraceae bacterium]